MARPRMCFTLLYANTSFNLSRNFNLQAVGDFNWLLDNYEFESIARSIDELFIFNVDRVEKNWPKFSETVRDLVKHCFMPVAVGGGISTFENAEMLFENGADKVVLNSAYFKNPDLVRSLVEHYGAQSIVASIDFKRDDKGETSVYIGNGAESVGLDLTGAISLVAEIGAGEILLNSIDRDGTGMGFDLDALRLAHESCAHPIIAAGGADTYDRLAEGLCSGFVTAVTTAHLFNFMCDGLRDARHQLIIEGVDLSEWDFSDFNSEKKS